MPRINFTITEEMHSELSELADETSTPIAALIRDAIKAYLEQRGRAVESRVQWGGERKQKADE